MSVSNVLNYDQENPVDYRDNAEYYYNLTIKLAKQIKKLEEEGEEREEEEIDGHIRKNKEIETLKTKIKQLQDKIKDKEAIIQEKENIIKDKDRMIGILEKAIDMIGAK